MIPLARFGNSVAAVLLSLLFVLNAAHAATSNAPPGAIILFDGQDTAQWVMGSGAAAAWNVTNGVLTVVPGTGNIRTWQWFEDVQLHLEFRFLTNSPAGTGEGSLHNSGVFFQSQFEIQVMESYNRTITATHDCAAIYSIRGPDSKAALPNGMWETFDITFRAARWTNGVKMENARVSVWWNGVLVQDNAEISRPTASGAPPETPPPGPITLQDLVGPVQFRNIWALPLTQPRAPGPESLTLVPAGSDWRYLDDGSDQGAAWRAPGFDDSAWSSGVAQFGYGDNDEVTLLRSNRLNATRIETTYFRKPFVITNAWAITNLALGVLRDDGGIVYLNGTEIFRNNITNTPVSYTNWAAASVGGTDETRFFTTNVNPAFLMDRTNWLAAEIHQQSASSTDVSFDLRLTALAWHPPMLASAHAANSVALLWPSQPYGFALEWAKNLSSGAIWSLETNAPVTSSNGFSAAEVDLGSPMRFYRLRRQ